MLLDKLDAFRAEPYIGPAGEWTVGFGHKMTTSEISSGKIVINGMACRTPLTTDQGRALRDQDIAIASSSITWNLEQHQREALVSFVIDIGHQAFVRSTLCAMLTAAAPVAEIAKEMRKWVKVRSTKTGAVEVSKALTLRRRAQANHLLGL